MAETTIEQCRLTSGNSKSAYFLYRFDELHFGKHVNMYMKNTFYYDAHPPFGSQLVSAAAYVAGYKGRYRALVH